MALQQKIDEVNVITAPEIEMLIIHAEGAYDQFKRSGTANIPKGEYSLSDLLR